MKIVENARFRSCAARCGQIAFLSGKVVKIVTLAWNSLQNEETVRFPWKLAKTCFAGHATWNNRFVQFSWKAHCFPVFKRIWHKSNDFEKFDPKKYDLGKTSYAWPETSVLYNFHKKRTLFPVFTSFSGHCNYFENFDAQKCELAKTCCAWPETSVFYNFHEKRTAFPFWREFTASVTILTTLTLKNAIRPKRAAHDLKRAFCTIFMKSALFSRFDELFRPVWRFWQLWRP